MAEHGGGSVPAFLTLFQTKTTSLVQKGKKGKNDKKGKKGKNGKKGKKEEEPSFEELLPFIKECQKELKEKEPTNKCALLDPNSCKEEAVKEEEVKDIQ